MPEFDSTIQYRDIQGFPGYKVGNDGSVWSCWEVYHPPGVKGGGSSRMANLWRPLRLRLDDAGRPCINLRRNSLAFGRRACRLVLEAFVGPCPKGMECCHFPDRNPTNNRLSNLRWDTRAANSADSVLHGTRIRGEQCGATRLTEGSVKEIKRLLRLGAYEYMIAAKYGVVKSTINWIARGVTWRHVSDD